MKTILETITPELAAQWLQEFNQGNRPLRESQVNYLVTEIMNAEWKVTHQGIAFADTGRLLDGQHRLSAIAKAGRPVDCMVTRGIPEDSFTVIDCGLKRANYDRTQLLEGNSINQIVVQSISVYLRCTRPAFARMQIPIWAIDAEFDARRSSWEWAVTTLGLNNRRISSSHIVAALSVYRTCYPRLAADFAEGLTTGVGLGANSPVLRLRNAALEGRRDRNQTPNYWKAQAAMQAHREGRTLIRFDEAGKDMLGQENRPTVKSRSRRTRNGNLTRAREAVAATVEWV